MGVGGKAIIPSFESFSCRYFIPIEQLHPVDRSLLAQSPNRRIERFRTLSKDFFTDISC